MHCRRKDSYFRKRSAQSPVITTSHYIFCAPNTYSYYFAQYKENLKTTLLCKFKLIQSQENPMSFGNVFHITSNCICTSSGKCQFVFRVINGKKVCQDLITATLVNIYYFHCYYYYLIFWAKDRWIVVIIIGSHYSLNSSVHTAGSDKSIYQIFYWSSINFYWNSDTVCSQYYVLQSYIVLV